MNHRRCCLVSATLLLCLSSNAASKAAPPSTRAITAALQPFVDNHTLAGAVTLVANKDKVLSLDAVGFMDLGARQPMRTDCLFWIASMSKPMTAAGLMMLVDEGRVSLDDPVEKYLPEFRGQMLVAEQTSDHLLLKSPSHPITIREVLSHTSGLPFMSRVEHKIDSFTLHEASISYALTALTFQPGTRHVYSNAGINTAGRIIEVVSGMPYEEFMEKRLFEPLGMSDTTFWPTQEQLARLANSYRPKGAEQALEKTTIEQLTYPLDNRKRGPSPAGGLFSTASDVGVFCRMILGRGVYSGKRYLSASAIQQMTSTQTGNLLNSGRGEGGYGLGWSTSRKLHGPNDPAPAGPCGHGGAYSTNMWIDPPRGLITVYMVQHAGYPGKDGPRVQPAFQRAAETAFAK
jgi:CubicO group peptidase (beta-lactamase class C family)